MSKRTKKIIIEGPDNVGKSSLIRNIIKHYKHPFLYLHYYANPTGEVQWGKDIYDSMFQIFHQNKYVIADRSHLGELIYPKLYHGYDGNYVLDIEKKYNTQDIIMFVLIDEPENLIKRDDGLSFSTDLKKKTQEIDLFREAFEKSNIKNKYLINIKRMDAEKLQNEVIKLIGE